MPDILRKLFPKGDKAPMSLRRIRVLVVEENASTLSVIGRRLTHMGYDVVLAEGSLAALAVVQTQRFDLILIDADDAAASGTATLRKMQTSGMMGDASALLITGHNDAAAIIHALAAGADDTIAKPFDFDVLDARIQHIVARARHVAELKRQNEQMDARIARRAMELGEAKAQLEELTAAGGLLRMRDPHWEGMRVGRA